MLQLRFVPRFDSFYYHLQNGRAVFRSVTKKNYMKKLFSVSVLGILLLFSSCDKNDADGRRDECFEATIIAEICGNAVLQINDKDFEDLGVDGWTSLEVVYDNVFFTRFNCSELSYFGKLARPSLTGLKVKVSVIDSKDWGSCAVCQAALSNPPSKYLNVEILDDNCVPVE